MSSPGVTAGRKQYINSVTVVEAVSSGSPSTGKAS